MDTNSKKGAFVLLVQTRLLLKRAELGFANHCLAAALAIHEKVIPDDVEQACKDLVDCAENDFYSRPSKRPEWYPNVVHGLGGMPDSFKYPWCE